MQKIIILSLFVLTTTAAFAQNIKEGYVKYAAVNSKGDALTGVQANQQAMYFNKKYTKIKSDMFGGLAKTSAIVDNKTQALTLVTDGAFGKNVVTESADNATKPKVSITYDAKSKKKIMGYDCTKAVVKSGKGEIVLYITDKITPIASPFAARFPELKGFPLEFSTLADGQRMTFAATEVGTKIDKKEFHIPTEKEGYKRMTMKEFEKIVNEKMSGGK